MAPLTIWRQTLSQNPYLSGGSRPMPVQSGYVAFEGEWRTSDARIAALAEPADKDAPSISRIHLMCFQTNFFHPSWASCSPTIPSPPCAHMTDTDHLSAL